MAAVHRIAGLKGCDRRPAALQKHSPRLSRPDVKVWIFERIFALAQRQYRPRQVDVALLKYFCHAWMLRISGSIDVLDLQCFIDRIFVSHFHNAEYLSALGIYERDLFLEADTSGGFGIDRDRDRDRPEHTACQFHVEARSAPIVMPYEAVQRRVGPHGQHEQIGDGSRIERYFPQLFGALSL